MIRNTLSRLVLPAIAALGLVVSAGPAQAAGPHGGVHAGGGVHPGGGFHPGGGYHPGGYHAGFGGYHPAYGYGGFRRFDADHFRHYGYGYPAYGNWYAPYYGYGFGYDMSYPTFPSLGSYDATPPGAVGPDLGSATPYLQSQPVGSSTGAADSAIKPPVPTASPAHFTVRLPDDASIWFDGTEMPSRGSLRRFDSPPLAAGHQYSYRIRARWTDNGQVLDQTQTVTFRADHDVLISFPVSSGELTTGLSSR